MKPAEPGISTPASAGVAPMDVLVALAEHVRILIAVPLALGLVALGISFLIPPTYTATTHILPPIPQQGVAAQLSSQLGPLAGLIGGASGLKSPVDQYVALIKSRTVLDAMVNRFKLNELYHEPLMEDARKALDAHARVAAGTKDGIIAIEVDDHDPRRAADMANAFVEELRRLTTTLAITEAGQRRLFFERQLVQEKDALTRSEIALGASGVGEGTLKVMPQSALEALARLKAQITAQEIKLASMRTFMTESNPEFRLATQELAALHAQLAKVEETNSNGATGSGAEYIAKYRDFKYHETLFELLSKQYEVARLDEAREGAVIQVVDAAVPPERKSRPKKALIAIFVTLATFFLLALALAGRMVWGTALQDASFAEQVARLKRSLRVRRA